MPTDKGSVGTKVGHGPARTRVQVPRGAFGGPATRGGRNAAAVGGVAGHGHIRGGTVTHKTFAMHVLEGLMHIYTRNHAYVMIPLFLDSHDRHLSTTSCFM